MRLVRVREESTHANAVRSRREGAERPVPPLAGMPRWEQVDTLRECGFTWGQVARVLGVSLSGAKNSGSRALARRRSWLCDDDASARVGEMTERSPRKSSTPRTTLTATEARQTVTTVTTVAEEYDRPMTRGDCRGDTAGGERPCPWVSCRHHLYLDVNPDTGSIKIAFPDLEPWELAETCSLDVAERGGVTLEEVGDILNLTRERIRQVETRGILMLRKTPATRALR